MKEENILENAKQHIIHIYEVEELPGDYNSVICSNENEPVYRVLINTSKLKTPKKIMGEIKWAVEQCINKDKKDCKLRSENAKLTVKDKTCGFTQVSSQP